MMLNQNQKNGLVLVKKLLLVLTVILAGGLFTSSASGQVSTQLCMILDGSGSISSSDWTIIVNGVADAVENPQCMPQDGGVELTVVQFAGTTATVEVSPTVITSANASATANQIRAIVQSGGSTPLATGFKVAANTLKASANFDPSIKQALNVATDGVPNVIDPDIGGVDGKDSAILAQNYAIAQLSMTSDDEIDVEGIGITDTNRDWLKDKIVYPQPGHIAPPYTPGWVIVVADAQAFADSVCEKIISIVPPPPPPTPAAVPTLSEWGVIILSLLLVGTAILVLRRRSYIV